MTNISLLVRVPQANAAYPVAVPADTDPDVVAATVAKTAELAEGRYSLKLFGSLDFSDQVVVELIANAPEQDVVVGAPRRLA